MMPLVQSIDDLERCTAAQLHVPEATVVCCDFIWLACGVSHQALLGQKYSVLSLK